MWDDDLGGVRDAKVKAALRRLAVNPDAGKPLGGKLLGYRSIRLEGSENRVVYRQVDMGGRAVIEVIAISRRRADGVYRSAEKRI